MSGPEGGPFPVYLVTFPALTEEQRAENKLMDMATHPSVSREGVMARDLLKPHRVGLRAGSKACKLHSLRCTKSAPPILRTSDYTICRP